MYPGFRPRASVVLCPMLSRGIFSARRTVQTYLKSSSPPRILRNGFSGVPGARKHGAQTFPRSNWNPPLAKDSPPSGLARLPTSALLRNVFLGICFSFPTLWKSSFAVLKRISESRSRFLDPDDNLLLRSVLKPLLYNQFCAGTNTSEIFRTRDSIKSLGYSGVALCYGKEVQVSQDNKLHPTGTPVSREIQVWRDGNLDTLDMVGPGDWLGIKLTGAGSQVTTMMMQGRQAPAALREAMDAICEKAALKGCRVWIDAEQQVLQPSIDRWTIDLMRQYNKDGRALVYNTIQAYLKSSREKLVEQLTLSSQEGWSLAVKLVRGAYIESDQRSLIHNTKEDTDQSYDGIVRDMLSGTNLGLPEDKFPKHASLLIAGHNPESVESALHLIQNLKAQNRLKVLPEFAQLQGMGDVLGCQFLAYREKLSAESGLPSGDAALPRMYKCLTWGTVRECMQYLLRRGVENSGATDRMRNGLAANVYELRRRMFWS